MRWLRGRRTAFEVAQDQAKKSDQMVCGTFKPDGVTAVYFTASKDATPDQINQLAFVARYDRPPNDSDEVLADLVSRVGGTRG